LILVDINVLLYATLSSAREHRACRAWLEDAFERYPRVGLPWHSLLGFVRIVTHPRLASPAIDVAEAWEQVEDWLDQDAAWIPEPTERHRQTLGRLLGAARATGNLVSDAHLAALALDHGLTLFSTDSDFAAFPGLRWKNPLTSS
jgi:uncharacterized protein